jgi:hypothetical protein
MGRIQQRPRHGNEDPYISHHCRHHDTRPQKLR